jgi:hypothetical protein
MCTGHILNVPMAFLLCLNGGIWIKKEICLYKNKNLIYVYCVLHDLRVKPPASDPETIIILWKLKSPRKGFFSFWMVAQAGFELVPFSCLYRNPRKENIQNKSCFGGDSVGLLVRLSKTYRSNVNTVFSVMNKNVPKCIQKTTYRLA